MLLLSDILAPFQGCTLQHWSNKLGFVSFASLTCLQLGREDLGPSWAPLLTLSPGWACCFYSEAPNMLPVWQHHQDVMGLKNCKCHPSVWI